MLSIDSLAPRPPAPPPPPPAVRGRGFCFAPLYLLQPSLLFARSSANNRGGGKKHHDAQAKKQRRRKNGSEFLSLVAFILRQKAVLIKQVKRTTSFFCIIYLYTNDRTPPLERNKKYSYTEIMVDSYLLSNNNPYHAHGEKPRRAK